MFWSISLLVLLAAGLVTLWPLLDSGSNRKLAALAGVVLLPVAGYVLYQGVGTPEALDPALSRPRQQAQEAPAHTGMTDLGTLTERLRQRLEASPDDFEGWVLLGRSYKNLQNYTKAIEALETADRLSPGQPLVQVELVEAKLYASGNSQFTPEMTATLEKAVATDPSQQKGMWLLGIAAAQNGDDERALEWLEKLRLQVEPGSPVEQTLLAQIDQIRTRLGRPPEEVTMPGTAAATAAAADSAPAAAAESAGTDVRVELSATASNSWPQLATGSVPPGAVLFVIIRPEGMTGGPPLGARRVIQPQFPLQLTLTDADSMVPQRPISSATTLNLQARLSLSGRPTPTAGDWQSASSAVAANSDAPITLILDQKVE